MRPGEIPVHRAVIPARDGGKYVPYYDARGGCHPPDADPAHEARVAAYAARLELGGCLFEPGPVPVDERVARRGKGRLAKRVARFEFSVRVAGPVPKGGHRTRVVKFGEVGCVNCARCSVLLIGERWAWVKAAAVRDADRDRLPAVVAGRVDGRPVCEGCKG